MIAERSSVLSVSIGAHYRWFSPGSVALDCGSGPSEDHWGNYSKVKEIMVN